MSDQNALQVPPGATVAQYITKKWGIKTRLVPLQVFAVLATPSRIIKNNPRRFGLTILNQGTSAVFLGWDSSVSITNGLFLAPTGGSISLVVDEDAELISYDMWAVSAAAGNNLSIWETESL